MSVITNYKSLINYIGPYNENTSIKVALFDTGINLTKYKNNLLINPGEIPKDHLDNDGNGLIDDINGWNFVDNNNNVTDTANNQHGTLSASFIYDLYKNVKFLPVKILDNGGNNNDAVFINALKYAIDRGVNIINMPIYTDSLNAENLTGPINNLIQEAWSRGIIIVNAVGNFAQNNRSISDLSKMANVVGVGSITNDFTKSIFSQYGSSVDIVAPGDSVFLDNSTTSGTSISCSIISGVFAVFLGSNDIITKDKIVNMLYRTATDINQTGYDYFTGYGVANVDLGEKSLNDFVKPSIQINNNKILITDNVGIYQINIIDDTNKSLIQISKMTNNSISIDLAKYNDYQHLIINATDYNQNLAILNYSKPQSLDFKFNVFELGILVIMSSMWKKRKNLRKRNMILVT